MKNVKLIDNSHMSGSSESESNLNKILKSNNSLKRFNDKKVENKSAKKNTKSNNEISLIKDSKNEPYTSKFLNKTVKENENSKEKVNKKENMKTGLKSTEHKIFKETQKFFKISLNPFPVFLKNTKDNLSSSNVIIVKNPSLTKIKIITDSGTGKNYKKYNIIYKIHV